jgi:hypothetical protein
MPVSRGFVARLRHAADPALDPPALRGLDRVTWAAVGHAHGKATDVPVLLRAAAADEPDARELAFDLLYETIWHAGTVYDATPLVVPFLYRLLEADETPDKQRVAGLLATIAGHSHTGDDEDLAACRRAGKERLDLLYPYLRDRDWSVRQVVAMAIGRYPELVARLLPDLEAALRDEPDKRVRLALILAIGQSSEAAARLLPDLEAALRDEPDEWFRQALQEVIELLTRAAADPARRGAM